MALPVVTMEQQKAMAAAVIISDRVLADLEAPARPDLLPASRDALAQAPRATAWAVSYVGDARLPRRTGSGA